MAARSFLFGVARPGARAAARKSTSADALAPAMNLAAPGEGWAAPRNAKCVHGLPGPNCPLCRGGGPPLFPGGVALAVPKAPPADALYPDAASALRAARAGAAARKRGVEAMRERADMREALRDLDERLAA